MSKSVEKEIVKEGAGVAAGATLPVGAVALAGEAGLSAVGMTTGLAALGLGSMATGIGVVALIGIGGYIGGKWVVGKLFGDEEEETK